MPETLKIEGKNLLKRLNANSDVYLKILYEIWSKAIKTEKEKSLKKGCYNWRERRQNAYHVHHMKEKNWMLWISYRKQKQSIAFCFLISNLWCILWRAKGGVAN